ncbi:hypothetical protein TL16_g10097 [Triparma laevis f. inornata]|uniref:Uncharacterized protein n=1 Tax=Triparma laevis f. inornata TaxID=1714386 RepID=A0A9W7EPM5_9STRA|nr:hypothetical protein TL16_g10097 [Triparma laevis f. inornata]
MYTTSTNPPPPPAAASAPLPPPRLTLTFSPPTLSYTLHLESSRNSYVIPENATINSSKSYNLLKFPTIPPLASIYFPPTSLPHLKSLRSQHPPARLLCTGPTTVTGTLSLGPTEHSDLYIIQDLPFPSTSLTTIQNFSSLTLLPPPPKTLPPLLCFASITSTAVSTSLKKYLQTGSGIITHNLPSPPSILPPIKNFLSLRLKKQLAFSTIIYLPSPKTSHVCASSISNNTLFLSCPLSSLESELLKSCLKTFKIDPFLSLILLQYLLTPKTPSFQIRSSSNLEDNLEGLINDDTFEALYRNLLNGLTRTSRIPEYAILRANRIARVLRNIGLDFLMECFELPELRTDVFDDDIVDPSLIRLNDYKKILLKNLEIREGSIYDLTDLLRLHLQSLNRKSDLLTVRGLSPCVPNFNYSDSNSLKPEGFPLSLIYTGPNYVRCFANLLEWKDKRRWSVSVQWDEVVGRFGGGVKVKEVNGRKEEVEVEREKFTGLSSRITTPIDIRLVENEGKCKSWSRTPTPFRINSFHNGMTVPSKPSKPSHLHLMSLEKCRSMNNSGLAWITIDPSSRYMSRIFLKQPEFCSAEMTFYDGNEENQVYGLRQLAEGGSVRLSNECYVYRGVIEECLRGRSAHTTIEHSCVVRAHAALCLGQWGIYRAPRDRGVNRNGWKTIDAVSKYWEERLVGVVRARKRRKEKGGKKRKYDWVWADEGGGSESESESEEEDESGEDSEEEVEEKKEYDWKWVTDYECMVRTAVVYSVACLRAQDGNTPSVAIDWLYSRIGDGLALEEKRVGECEGAPEGFDEEGYKLAEEFNMDPWVGDIYLALSNVNVTNYSDSGTAPNPITKLVKLCHDKVDDLADVGGDIFAGALHSLVILAVLRDNSDRLKNKTTGEVVEGEEKRKDLPQTETFYSNIYDSTPTISAKAVAAQAFCIASVYRDSRRPKTEPCLGLITSLEFLLSKIIETSDNSLKYALLSVAWDLINGKITTPRAFVLTSSRYTSSTSALNRCLNGPLGSSLGDFNASGKFIDVKNSKYNPAVGAINGGVRRGFDLVRTAGNKKKGEKGVEVVVRVAR